MNTRELMVNLELIHNLLIEGNHKEAEHKLRNLRAQFAETETVLNGHDCRDIITKYDAGKISFVCFVRAVRNRTDVSIAELKQFCEKFR